MAPDATGSPARPLYSAPPDPIGCVSAPFNASRCFPLEHPRDLWAHRHAMRAVTPTDLGISQGRSDAEIGRAHVCTPVTNAQLVCRLLLEKKKDDTTINDKHVHYSECDNHITS